ncbi:ribbon-helix-helix domain-containing protein [Promethearchaeum syntrophicum]|uniref:Ribbon-helix-helix domain-containing protein n=1 Tax=Promethearchaeum syntrophicum TaxID=2594042 RepID=A0A5B9D902_9ARCH|nr:ribbon-helix-helix domain-containing protein [Candidatus Prometheoarchaeum syntrophicum]QEE15543.1 nickel responsive regulator [Candidatus Prometheoarchaeum syntrophicum]
MQTLQIRLPKKLLKQVDEIIHKGFYSSRSDFLKEATRKYVLDFNFAGSLPYIVGPYSKEELETLKSDPKDNLFLSRSKIKDINKELKNIKVD